MNDNNPKHYDSLTDDAVVHNVYAEKVTRYKQVLTVSKFTLGRSSTVSQLFIVFGILLAAIAVNLMSVFFIVFYDINNTFLALLTALIPASFVVFVVSLLNRWDVKPFILLVVTFLWGAGNATLSALILNTGISLVLYSANVAGTDLISSAVIAPVVEEVGKGLFILLLFLVFRKFFTTPLDGVIYASFVAVGFAFMENILYFANSLESGGSAYLFQTFFVRGVISPFAHLTFTILIGLGIGVGALYKGVKPGLAGFFFGLSGAILLHAIWNGAAVLIAGIDPLLYLVFFAVVEFPIFVGMIITAVLVLNRQKRKTFQHLIQYAAAGFFTVQEVNSLATGKGRRAMLRWASTIGVTKLVKNYFKQVTYLTVLKDRISKGDRSLKLIAEEQETLKHILYVRDFINKELIKNF